jgi:hypothetical protein
MRIPEKFGKNDCQCWMPRRIRCAQRYERSEATRACQSERKLQPAILR